jgi:hypothetical protein
VDVQYHRRPNRSHSRSAPPSGHGNRLDDILDQLGTVVSWSGTFGPSKTIVSLGRLPELPNVLTRSPSRVPILQPAAEGSRIINVVPSMKL